MNPIVLEVQLNRAPPPLDASFENSGGYTGELWYPTVSENGVISWAVSTRKIPPDPVDITGPRGLTGNGIASVDLISGDHSPGTYDTYRMTFTDGTYLDYQVYNGDDATAATYIHEQETPASVWTIQHNLGRYPSVTVVDTAGTEMVGDVQYVNENSVILTFRGTFSGTAYLN